MTRRMRQTKPVWDREGEPLVGRKWSSWSGALSELSVKSSPKFFCFFPIPVGKLSLENSELDIIVSDWLNIRRRNSVTVSGGDTVSYVCE